VNNVNAYYIDVSDKHDVNTAVELCAVELVNRSIPISAIHIERQTLQSLFLEINASDRVQTEQAMDEKEVPHVA